VKKPAGDENVAISQINPPGSRHIPGSSRALFDIDLPNWRAEAGNRPVIQLAKEGSAPRYPSGRDLLKNTDFAGTLVVSVSPGLFFFKNSLHDDDAERDSFFMEIKSWADKLRARGGKMVFIRPPSAGMLFELEEQSFPRTETWDKLLEKTGVPGIHFKDYPDLQGLELPKWSHLRAEHTVPFTKALAKRVLLAW
jgi:hypothetical protein